MHDDKQELRRRLLGWGLACPVIADDPGLGRDLAMAPGATPGSRDLGLVEGIENLGQALEIALTTPLGGDTLNADFGFDGLNALVEETSPVMIQERVRVSIVTLLRRERRVARVVDVELADGRLSAPTAGKMRELNVRVVFETISADTAALQMGRVLLNG